MRITNFKTRRVNTLGVVGAIVICGAILIICVFNLRNRKD